MGIQDDAFDISAYLKGTSYEGAFNNLLEYTWSLESEAEKLRSRNTTIKEFVQLVKDLERETAHEH